MRKYLISLALMLALVGSLVTRVALAQSDMAPEAVVEGFAEAYLAGDVDAAVSYFADDASMLTLPEELFSPDGPLEGLDEIRTWIEGDIESGTYVELTVEEVDGNTVHALLVLTANDLVALGIDAMTGTSDFVVEDGQIVTMVNTFDQASVDAIMEVVAAIAEGDGIEMDEDMADDAEEDMADEDMDDEDMDDDMDDEDMDGDMDDDMMMEEDGCAALPGYDEVTEALSAVQAEENGGFGFDMWGTVVDRSGTVCVVTRTGEPGEQWPGSRVISAQKANTANAFSLPGLALSTANLFNAVQPGNSLFGLQESNPVDTDVAYAGPAADWGTANDPMVGYRIGGVNVFGGGLALYDADGELLGALGVSGDSSCADHAIAWKLRDTLGLDFVPGGVSETGDDNMIFGLDNGFGHPECGLGELDVVPGLPESNPLE